jgi:hypothetical protein
MPLCSAVDPAHAGSERYPAVRSVLAAGVAAPGDASVDGLPGGGLVDADCFGDHVAEGFYRLVDAAHERRSLAVFSNLHPSGFDEIMPKTLATATVDRLLHHTRIVVTQGDSFQLNQATTDQG